MGGGRGEKTAVEEAEPMLTPAGPMPTSAPPCQQSPQSVPSVPSVPSPSPTAMAPWEVDEVEIAEEEAAPTLTPAGPIPMQAPPCQQSPQSVPSVPSLPSPSPTAMAPWEVDEMKTAEEEAAPMLAPACPRPTQAPSCQQSPPSSPSVSSLRSPPSSPSMRDRRPMQAPSTLPRLSSPEHPPQPKKRSAPSPRSERHLQAKWARTRESRARATINNDWTCPTCGNVNWFRRGHCIGGRNQCRTPRETGWVPGDWFCNCGNHNLAAETSATDRTASSHGSRARCAVSKTTWLLAVRQRIRAWSTMRAPAV
jgi:hypothetical protein